MLYQRMSKSTILSFLIFSLIYIKPAPSASLPPLLKQGEAAPPFTLSTPGGVEVTYSPRGKPSVLIFWSAFCPVCREVMIDINAGLAEFDGRVTFLTVNMDGKRFSNAVENFLSQTGVPFPVVYDNIVRDLFVAADKYGVRKTPTIFFVDTKGVVAAVLEGDEGRNFIALLLEFAK